MAERNRAAVDVHPLAIQAELFLDRQVLGRKRFVDLDEIEILQRQSGSLQHQAGRGRRTHSHQRRFHADNGPVCQPRQRLQPVRLDARLRRQEQCRAAINDAGGIAGRHASILAEGRGQLRQPFHRGVRPQVIVAGKQLASLPRLDFDRHHFVVKSAGFPGGISELLAAERVAVLLLAGDAVFRRAVLCSRGHGAAAMGIQERGPQRVFELPLTEPQAIAESTDHMRRLAHALHAARQDDVRLA